MSNDSLIDPIQNNRQLAYNYDSISSGEASIFESSEKEYPDDITFIDYKELFDEELVTRYLENEDEEAFNEIVDRYGWKIHRLAFRITHDMRNADDVLQEVFLTLVEKLHTFRQEARFSTWLYRVATTVSFLYLRKEKKYQQQLSLENLETYDKTGYAHGAELQDWSSIPDDIVMRREQKGKIEKAISEMPEINRVVFHLSDLEGLTSVEIGEILGISLSAVKSRIRRARLFLRDKLSDNLYRV
ncbi:MAG: sigma-70 family RNA polymerase sigma factor [Deltaproteobacteria bacterium]